MTRYTNSDGEKLLFSCTRKLFTCANSRKSQVQRIKFGRKGKLKINAWERKSWYFLQICQPLWSLNSHRKRIFVSSLRRNRKNRSRRKASSVCFLTLTYCAFSVNRNWLPRWGGQRKERRERHSGAVEVGRRVCDSAFGGGRGGADSRYFNGHACTIIPVLFSIVHKCLKENDVSPTQGPDCSGLYLSF